MEDVRAVANRDHQAATGLELSFKQGPCLLVTIRSDQSNFYPAGQLIYLCHRLDYHWYMGHLQGGDGSLGKFSLNQEMSLLMSQAYFLLLTWMSLQVLEDPCPFRVKNTSFMFTV